MSWLLVSVALAGSPCGSLEALGERAAEGLLSARDEACLSGLTYRSADRMQASSVLLENYWVRQDLPSWSALANRHLDQIDGSDPMLLFRVVRHRFASADYEDTITLASRAIRSTHSWETTEGQLLLAVHSYRTVAAAHLWNTHGHGAARVHLFAQEWLEAASAQHADTELAQQLCEITGAKSDCSTLLAGR